MTFPKYFFTILFIGLMSLSGTSSSLKYDDDLVQCKREFNKCQTHYNELAYKCSIVANMFEQCMAELEKKNE